MMDSYLLILESSSELNPVIHFYDFSTETRFQSLNESGDLEFVYDSSLDFSVIPESK